MAEIITKSYKKNKSIVWVIAGILLLGSIILFGTLTSSNSDDTTKQYIVYGDHEPWEIVPGAAPDGLITNEDSIRFIVDLRQDFDRLELINSGDEGAVTPVNPEDPETTGETSDSGGNSNEPTSPESDEEGEAQIEGTETEPGTGEEPDPSANPENIDYEEAPFSVSVFYQMEKLTEDDISITPIKGENDKFAGEFEVIINLPDKTKEGLLSSTVEFIEENTWGIAATSNQFSIELDKLDPKINVETTFNKFGEEFVEGGFTTGSVSMDIDLDDNNIDLEKSLISILIDDNAEPIEYEWDRNNSTELKFTDIGDYKVTITAYDRAGNSFTETVTFGIINNEGPQLTINGSIGDSENEKYYQSAQIVITNDIKMNSAVFTIKRLDDPSVEPIQKELENRSKKFEFSVSDEGKYQVSGVVNDRKGTHELGNYIFTIDQTKPIITIDGVKHNEVYSEEDGKLVTVAIADENLDDETKAYTVTKNGVEYPIEGLLEEGYTFIEDGVYDINVTAQDLAGNSRTEEVRFTIDTSNPIIEINGIQEGEHYNKQTVDVNITVRDLSFMKENTTVVIKKDGVETPIEEYQGEWDFWNDLIWNLGGKMDLTFKEQGLYEITVESIDSKGWKNTVTRTFAIDREAPGISIKREENNNLVEVEHDDAYGTDTAITIDVTDLNLVHSENPDIYDVTVEVTKNGEEFEIGPLTLTKAVSITELDKVSISHKFTEEGVYGINVFAKDKAGNSNRVEDLTFTIDKSEPIITFEGITKGKHYDKNTEELNLKITVEDLTFKENKDNEVYTTVLVTRDGDEVPLSELTEDGWSKKEEKKWLKKGEMDLTFTEEGEYVVTVSSEDQFERITTETFDFVIDRTEPMVSMSGIDEGSFLQNGSVEIKVIERYFNTNEVTVTVTKDGGQLEEKTFEKSAEESSLVLPFSADGDYVINVTAKDEAGNEANIEEGSTLTRSFTIDTTAPVIQISGVADGSYNAGNKSVTIDVTEHNFQNNKVEFKVIQKDIVSGKETDISEVFAKQWANKGEKSSVSYEFKEDYEYTIQVNSEDKAGNNAESKKVTFTIDHVDPKLTVEGVQDTDHYQRKTGTFTVQDTNIDLGKTVLRIERNGKTYDAGSLKMVAGTITTATLTHSFTQEGDYRVFFESTDKAGRKTVYDALSFTIDSTKPVLKIEGVEHDSFNPASKNVTVSVDESNYATNQVELTVTKDGRSFNIGKLVTNQNKLSKLSYNFNEDGLYTVALNSTDKAGNIANPVTRTFTIDKTRPTIEITGIDNNGFYNTDKPVNIRINDVNLDINRVTVTRDGRNYNAGGFSVNGEVASFNHNFSAEGQYRILAEATDKAGNSYSQEMTFTIDKTAPVITPLIGGSNRVIGNGDFINEIFTPNFSLDEQEDTIESITLNGNSVGTRAPMASRDMKYDYVVLAKDRAGNETTLNVSFTLDTTRPQLSITGVVDGFFNQNIQPTVTYSDLHLDSSKTSVKLNGEDFRNGMTLEYEDDYRLEAVITDLANNVTTRTIVFTIDKTAPIIKFEEPISDRYFNANVLPQLIIEDMTNYDIISMTLNGQDYNIGDPIETEGKHVLFFEVKDQAGNIQQITVEFILDKTPPAVTFEGVEKEQTYYNPVTVNIKLPDQDDFTNILLNGEVFNGEVLVEDGFKVIKVMLSDVKSYEFEVTATDEAENEITEVFSFVIAEKPVLVKFYENKPLFFGSIAGVLSALAGGTFFFIRKRKPPVIDVAHEE